MTAPIVNAAGQGMTLIGILLLFYFGMPNRVSTRGAPIVVVMPTAESIRSERMYEAWGVIGLILSVLGTLAQIGANFLSSN
jgi:hypothetical protein